MRNLLHHYLNALHIKCRLIQIGLSASKAMTVAKWWEKNVHPIIYGRS